MCWADVPTIKAVRGCDLKIFGWLKSDRYVVGVQPTLADYGVMSWQRPGRLHRGWQTSSTCWGWRKSGCFYPCSLKLTTQGLQIITVAMRKSVWFCSPVERNIDKVVSCLVERVAMSDARLVWHGNRVLGLFSDTFSRWTNCQSVFSLWLVIMVALQPWTSHTLNKANLKAKLCLMMLHSLTKLNQKKRVWCYLGKLRSRDTLFTPQD